jgi:hypothetical protein
MNIVDRGRVAVAEEGTDRASLCFPGVCAMLGGRWLVTFRAAPTKDSVGAQRTLLSSSDDGGRSWSSPREPWRPPLVDGKPGRFRAAHLTALGGERLLATLYWVDASDPSLPFFNEETEGLLESYLFQSLSRDGGESWSVPTRIDTRPYTVPTPITGPTLLLANGDWALQFETNKTYYDTSTWHHQSVLMFSADEGRSWPETSCAAADPDARIFYWDQRPAVLADGRVLDLFWTFDRESARYLNIHGRASGDHGRTWGELYDTEVPGQPAPPVGLADGRIVMVYVDRTVGAQIKARVSHDGGVTWPQEGEIVLAGDDFVQQTADKDSMQDAWTEMGKFSLGLPATAALGDDRFLVVYYAGPETDLTHIEWALVQA